MAVLPAMREPHSIVSSTGDSPFWRFSLQIYREPGIGETCIRLQDEHGVDVNVLLFLLWQALLGRGLSLDDVRRVEDTARPWRELCVVPLRVLRRRLKGSATAVPPDVTEAFRGKIKAVELEAERLEQEALFELSTSAPVGVAGKSVIAAARANIDAYQALLGARFPDAAVAQMLTALVAIASPKE